MNVNYDAEFSQWWAREFPNQPCPPTPRKTSELALTAQMAMRATAPHLYTNLFAGKNEVRLPADTATRLASGQLQPQDAAALRAAGYESHAQQAERMVQVQEDQRMAAEMARSREVYEQEIAKSQQWNQMGVLARMGHEEMTPDKVAYYRRLYGVSGR